MLEWRAGASPAWGRPRVCLLAPVDRVEGGCISLQTGDGAGGTHRGEGGAPGEP